MILKNFGLNVSSTVDPLDMTKSLTLVFICVLPDTSLQWWTTEEGCLVTAHSYCTRYVSHTVSKYNIWNI